VADVGRRERLDGAHRTFNMTFRADLPRRC